MILNLCLWFCSDLVAAVFSEVVSAVQIMQTSSFLLECVWFNRFHCQCSRVHGFCIIFLAFFSEEVTKDGVDLAEEAVEELKSESTGCIAHLFSHAAKIYI